MGTRYSSNTITAYNQDPPPDDGSETSANKTTWAKHVVKLANPIKTLTEAINSALVTHFDEGPDLKTTAYTTVAGDFGKTIECSGTFTVSLLDASTATAGYRVTVKNAGTGVITVDTDTGGDGIDGLTSLSLSTGEAVTVVVNSVANGYMRHGSAIGVPIGTVIDYAGSTAPDGWLFCDGSEVSETTYAALFAVLGSTYNTGGETAGFFRTPDLRGRVGVGKDDMGGTGAGRMTVITGTTLGASGGAQTHSLSAAEGGPHNHTYDRYAEGPQVQVASGSASFVLTAGGFTTPNVGGTGGSGASHNNTQPGLILNKIIKT